ncbi:MAG: 3-deoxy-D-manno-octulosonic acid transferase [Gammaproteobacteria bacterium]
MNFLYTALLYLLTPAVLVRLLWRARRAPAYAQRWGERFGRYPTLDLHDTIWIHAVSVGEVVAAVPLVRVLRSRYPQCPILMTTMTPTGSAQVRRLFGAEVQHIYVPYDLPHAVDNFLRAVRPRLALIMETELWPNLFRACQARGIPLIVANARLSARSAAGYRRFGALTRVTLRAVSVVAAQSSEDAQRFLELLDGVPMGSDSFVPAAADQSAVGRQRNLTPVVDGRNPAEMGSDSFVPADVDQSAVLEVSAAVTEMGSDSFACRPPDDQQLMGQRSLSPLKIPSIEVTGSIKFDMQLPPELREQGQALRRALGAQRPVWIAASTHEGEEPLLLDAHLAVRALLPDALLMLVPRHPERFARVRALCEQRGLTVITRSSQLPCAADTVVFLGDSMGELPLFYAAADLAFIGGSLIKHGGHNPLEAAALAVPLLFGPHMFNFAAISRLLLSEHAAEQVDDVANLGNTVTALLRDTARRHAMGERAQHLVEANRGALERLLQIVARYLDGAA